MTNQNGLYVTLVVDREEKIITAIDVDGNTSNALITSLIVKELNLKDEKAYPDYVYRRFRLFLLDARKNLDEQIPKKYAKWAKKVPQMVCGFSKVINGAPVW